MLLPARAHAWAHSQPKEAWWYCWRAWQHVGVQAGSVAPPPPRVHLGLRAGCALGDARGGAAGAVARLAHPGRQERRRGGGEHAHLLEVAHLLEGGHRG